MIYGKKEMVKDTEKDKRRGRKFKVNLCLHFLLYRKCLDARIRDNVYVLTRGPLVRGNTIWRLVEVNKVSK